MHTFICIRTVAQGGREERTNKTQNMVSISWYLPEKMRDEMSKTQHFQIFAKNIFQNLLSYIHLYVYIYTDSGTRREREREQATSISIQENPTSQSSEYFK